MLSVAITRNNSIERAIKEALGYLKLEDLIKGKVVAIKPNDTWASKEDTSALTQPDTLRATIRYLNQFSPRELIVTGGAGAAETDDVFRISGIEPV
ncbi:MAG: DUF362 domain-containing protein [Acidobacteriota bacterium]